MILYHVLVVATFYTDIERIIEVSFLNRVPCTPVLTVMKMIVRK